MGGDWTIHEHNNRNKSSRNAISPVPFAVQMDWIRLDRIDLNWIVVVRMIG